MPRLNAKTAAKRAANSLGQDFSESLARGMRVIATFSAAAPALTLSEVARRVDLPRATARRSLLTLAQLGYVREENRLFSLTPRILELASVYLSTSAAATILQPCCERLAADFQTTVSVAALDGDDAVMIAYATPRKMYMQSSGLGLRLPAFCSAVGRVLIAALAPAERALFMKRLRPKPVTARTETDKARLSAILDRVALEGYAIAEEEAELGYRSLAVPLYRADGRVAFALNTGMHVDRDPAERLRLSHLPQLLKVARELSAQLL